ncbi:hypothetical protein D3C80_1763340 [compost metagenome]
MLVDLVQRAPVVTNLAAKAVCYEGFTLFQVVLELVFLTIAAPVADHTPFVVRLRFKQRG